LALRDYLRSNPEARGVYAAAKNAAIAAGAKTLLVYSSHKANVVATLLRAALRDRQA